MSVLGTTRWREGAIALLLCANFLVPVQTALHDLQVRGLVPEGLSESWLWDTIVMAQHAWALLLLACVLLWTGLRARTVPAGKPARAST